MEKTYPFILTGFSECTKGAFKDDKPPQSMEDVLLEVQAIYVDKVDDTISGKILIADKKEELGEGPFNLQFYVEKRDPPYRTVGYSAVRTLSNVVLGEPVIEMDSFLHFKAESDTGWEEIDFLFEIS